MPWVPLVLGATWPTGAFPVYALCRRSLPTRWLNLMTYRFLFWVLWKQDAARVDAVVYSDSFGREHWKPSAVPYRAVAEALGVAHDACVYVADNPQKDFITARVLGWRTIQVAREGQTHAAAPPSAAHAAEVSAPDLRTALAVLAGWMG